MFMKPIDGDLGDVSQTNVVNVLVARARTRVAYPFVCKGMKDATS